MPRIFLVDDEQLVLDGLSLVIRKNLPDMEICGSARSGREAIDGVAAARPELLLLDVRMPGIDGLAALRDIRERLPEIVTILLTAYERFDVAKTAFELGVFDYLVKPASQERIIATLRAAADEVGKRKRERREAYGAKEALERAAPLVTEALVLSALFGSADGSAASGKAALDLLGLGGGRCMAAAFGLAPLEGEGFPPPSAAEELRLGLAAELPYFVDCRIGPRLGFVVPVIIPMRDGRDSESEIEQALRQFLVKGVLPGAAAGLSAPRPCEELGAALMEARAALGTGLEAGGLARPGSSASPALDQDACVKALLDAAAARDRQAALAALDRWLETQEAASPRLVLSRGRSLLALAFWFSGAGLFEEELFCATARGFQTGRAPGADIERRCADAWCVADAAPDFQAGGAPQPGAAPSAASVADIRDELRLVLAARLGPEAGAVRRRCGRQVEAAIRYIESNFDKQLSLEDVAWDAGLSPAHLSRLFVEQAGVSFIDYVTELRIDRAKALLRRGDVSVKDAALSSGYSDPNYFGRAFKKQAGMTPSEYAASFGGKR